MIRALGLILLSVNSFAGSGIGNRFYIGVNAGSRLDFSENRISDVYGETSLGTGISADASFRIGCYLTEKLFIESGFGTCQTALSFRFDAAPFYSTTYQSIKYRENWLHVPVRVGYILHLGKGFAVSSLLGCNIIVDGKPRHGNADPLVEESLRIKDSWRGTTPLAASGRIVMLNGHDLAALLYSGIRGSWSLGRGLSVHTDAGFSLGLRQVRGGTFMFRPDGQPNAEYQSRYSTFKGDALSIAAGVAYRF